MKCIIIVNGLPNSGKTTFENLVAKYAKTMIYSSVDFVKEVAKCAGWDGVKDEKGRLFLSQLKSIMTRYDDIPYKKVKEEVELFQHSDAEILFLDIREPEEIARAVKDFKALSVFVERQNNNQSLSNDSDRRVKEYGNYWFWIDNNAGLKELDAKAYNFVETLKKSW